MAKYIIYNRGLNPKITPKRENKTTKEKTINTLKMLNPLTTTPQRTNIANSDQLGTR